MKILIVQRIFAKYRKDILDELQREINFVLLHSVNKSSINQVCSSYSKKISSFQYSKKETNVFLNVFPYIFKNRPEIIIHEFSIGIVSLIPIFILARLFGIKFILWGHGYERTKGFYPEKKIIDKLRLFLIKKADAVIFYGLEAKLVMSKYLKGEKFFIAFNCLNTNTLSKTRDKLEKVGRENLKKKIGFNHKYNLIFIGRLLKSKQPQLLLDLCEHLINRQGNLICIHFVGDGDYLIQLKKIVILKGLENNIKFYGAIHDDIINGELLYCSDLMVMPGPVGLSVNHAFNFDCPVVTFEQDGHGPEIEYLINEKTGFIVETHTIEAMAFIISKYLKSKDIQYQMKINIRKMVETSCSIDSFIKGFVDAIKFVQS